MVGTAVRTLASHQGDLGFSPAEVSFISEYEFLPCFVGFSQGTPVSSLCKNPWLNSNSILGDIVNKDNL